MKTTILLSLILSFNLLAQYPLIENFNSINGPGEWVNFFGQPDVCAHNNNELCFNCTGSYNVNDVYVAISPYYANQFVVDLCDSVRITFAVDVNIRQGDVLYVLWSDYAAPGIFGAVVPGSGIWTIQIPPQVEWFAFQFETFGVGSPIGRYVHIDWFEIGCINYILDIDLYHFECTKTDNGIELISSLSDESHITLEWSDDGFSWETLAEFNGDYLNHIHKTVTTNNYYRLLYDDSISSIIYCEDDNPNIKIERIRYFNVLGQELAEPIKYHLRQITYENGNVKTTLIHKN